MMMFMGPRGPVVPGPGQAYMVPGYGLVMPHPMQVAMAQGRGPPMYPQPGMMGPSGMFHLPTYHVQMPNMHQYRYNNINVYIYIYVYMHMYIPLLAFLSLVILAVCVLSFLPVRPKIPLSLCHPQEQGVRNSLHDASGLKHCRSGMRHWMLFSHGAAPPGAPARQ